MEFIKLIISPYGGSYIYRDASNEEMTILGHFLASDVGCFTLSFKEWGLTEKWSNDETNGNLTVLKKDDKYIYLSDLFSEEEVPVELKMTREQYGQILTAWEEKVLKLRPKEWAW